MVRTNDMPRIGHMIKQLGEEIEALIRSCLELSWYSRGAWPYHTVLQMTAGERDMASSFISKRLETQSKSMYPIY
jgi:hypothetical protein